MTTAELAWIVAAAAFLLVLAGSRTVRRVLLAGWVGFRFTVAGVLARLSGRKGVAPEMMRRAFEVLGPTYIKLGQLVASSHGLFPRRYTAEFQKCLDRVQPFPIEEVRAILAEELGRTPEALFAEFDEEPLASASIAQVHAARLRTGETVVVKIQRPRIAERVDADVRILKIGARVLALRKAAELANPVGIVEDFDVTIHEELDFVREAANMDEFNRIMVELDHPDIQAPHPVQPLTTRRVLTMERLYGVRVDDVESIRRREVDAEDKLVLGLRAWFQCLILYGFFHGDVHAGNLMLLDDGRLGFLDFGIIGRFSLKQRQQVTAYIVAFATGDYKKLGEVMIEMGSVGAHVDLDAMAADLKEAYAPIMTLSFGDLKYGELLPSILRVSLKYKVRLPKEFVLVTKQMLYFDRYAKLLAPKLNIFSDPRLVSGLTEDLMRAQVKWAQVAAEGAAAGSP
jgi:predicted unusual protein kinase regulating ubiquinone biosynthesis (AarF/ABC1/UbiB family)